MVLGDRGVYKKSYKYRPNSSFANYRHSFNVTQTTFLFVFRCRFNKSWSPTIRCTFTWLMSSVSACIWLDFHGADCLVLQGGSHMTGTDFFF
jgi:hypothetical protein